MTIQCKLLLRCTWNLFPWGYSRARCRRHGFDPWVRKSPWGRKWQPCSIFLPGKSLGQRSLLGYSSWGSQKSWEWLSDWNDNWLSHLPSSFQFNWCFYDSGHESPGPEEFLTERQCRQWLPKGWCTYQEMEPLGGDWITRVGPLWMGSVTL